MKRFSFILATLGVGLTAVFSAASPETSSAPTIAPDAPSANVSSDMSADRSRIVRLQIDAIRLRINQSKPHTIDSEKLERECKSRETLVSELEKLGNVELLFRADRLVDVSQDIKLNMGVKIPTGMYGGTNDDGSMITKVDYDKYGIDIVVTECRFDAAAQSLSAKVVINASNKFESSIKLAPDHAIPIYAQFKTTESMRLTLGQAAISLASQDMIEGKKRDLMIYRWLLTDAPNNND